MDIKFSKMTVDTSLAQDYLKKNPALLELLNDYNGTIKKFDPYVYDGKLFYTENSKTDKIENKIPISEVLKNLALRLKQDANLITQLEYHLRNILIEDTRTQLNLLLQKIRCPPTIQPKGDASTIINIDDPLLNFGHVLDKIWNHKYSQTVVSTSRKTAAICHVFVSMCYSEGAKNIALHFRPESERQPQRIFNYSPFRGLVSGTVAVVAEDADVDSAVDKFLSVSKQAPWRLRKILVQESVYQQFKDALRWKCTLNSSGDASASDKLCSDTLTYDGKTFLIDPVELTEEKPSIVTVEAYRTTKEVISIIQQDQPRYLSLWANGIAEINEIVHSVKSPVVWVNNVADFRGPPQVSKAVFPFSYDERILIKKCDKVTKLCELSQLWTKLDLENRRDVLYDVLTKYSTLSDPTNKLYNEIRNSLSDNTEKSFVDVGKDYVCIGMSQPVGVMGILHEGNFFSVDSFKSLLEGNAFIVYSSESSPQEHLLDYKVLEQAGVPVVYVGDFVKGDFGVLRWLHNNRTRAIWTNSGTIFAN